MSFLLVFVGSGLGGAARHGVNLACLRVCGPGLPLGTLAVNVFGSLLMGALIGLLALGMAGEGAPQARLFLATGLLGGFTTFSAFSLDAVDLWQRGEAWLAAGYVGASVALSLAGLALGLAATRAAA